MDRLEKNFIWLSAANILSSLLGVVAFIYLTRVLEAEMFGYLSYALAFVIYFATIVNLGLSTYGTREISKNRPAISEYVSNIVSLRVVVAIVLMLVISAIAIFSRQPSIVKTLIIQSSLLIMMAALANEWAFQGIEKMHMVFISMVLTTFLQLVMMVAFVKRPEDAIKVPLIYFLGALPTTVIFLRMLKFRMRISSLDFNILKIYFSSSIIIWLISIFAQVYNGLDIVILGFFRRPEEVGYFAVAKRFVGGIAFLTLFLANAALPRFSCTYRDDRRQFDSVIRKFLIISGVSIVAFLIPVMIFSQKLIALIVGNEYIAAGVPLSIMTIGLVFILLNIPFSTALIACGFEKDVLKQTIASASLNVISNFILMPKYGMIGGSISFLAAEALALGWILTAYAKRLK